MSRRAPLLLVLALCALAALAARASSPRAVIDCGTLSGRGTVMITIEGQPYRVDVTCPAPRVV